MARKGPGIDSCPEIGKGSGFVRVFQEQLLLLLKKRGQLTEPQYRRALELLARDEK